MCLFPFIIVLRDFGGEVLKQLQILVKSVASAYRGKAAIFRIMESTMGYRGFCLLSFSVLVESSPATVMGLMVDFPG